MVFPWVQILDLMGYEPSPWNKINIHVGSTHGDKEATMQRWAEGLRRLSPACRARMTGGRVRRGFGLEAMFALGLHSLSGCSL